MGIARSAPAEPKSGVDPESVARRTTTPRMFGVVHQPLRLGAGLVGEKRARPGQLFEGAIDELLVYERALTADEIRVLSHGAAP